MANELEDILTAVFCTAETVNSAARTFAFRKPSVDMARVLGETQLADALDEAFRETLQAELPVALRTPHDFTFVQPPAVAPATSERFRSSLSRRTANTRARGPPVRVVCGLRG